MKDKVLGDFDKWFEPCRNCGYDPGKSTKNRCWNCGSGLQRDYSERALKPKPDCPQCEWNRSKMNKCNFCPECGKGLK